jgi:hypothetical protein
VNTISRKYKAAVLHLKESQEYFSELSEAVDDSLLDKWTEMMSEAELNRTSNIEAMDVFDVKFDKGMFPLPISGLVAYYLPLCPAETCAQKQLELVQQESASGYLQGSAAWLAEGLEIQEAQYDHFA